MDTSAGSTKERILEATIELLARDGWETVTVRGIGAAAGVNIALINYHFGSKTDLMLAALEAALEEAIVAPLDEASSDAEGTGWLRQLIRIALGADPPSDRMRIFESALAAAIHDPGLAARMRPMLERSRVQLVGRIHDAVVAGQMPATTDSAALAVVLTAMLDGLWLQRMIDPEIDVDRVADVVMGLMLGSSDRR